MDVILKTDIKGLGYKNDTVSVKPGYGRNYLITQGFAVIASPSNRKMFAENIKQAAHKSDKIKGDDNYQDVMDAAKELDKKMTEIEETLYQTKNRSGQDPLNFPIRLNNKLAALNGVAGSGAWRPTAQSETVRGELTQKIDGELKKLESIMQNDLPAFNEKVKQKSIDAIIIKKKKTKNADTSTSPLNN